MKINFQYELDEFQKKAIDYADWFRQPMKLSKRELTSLRAAGEALIAFSGSLPEEIEDELKWI